MANNEEIEIDLVRLGRYVLSKWKVILFWGVVFSCLGFCYKFFAFKFSDVPLEELDKQFKIVRDEKQPDGKVQRKEYKVSYRIYKDDYESRMREYRANLDSYKVTKDNLLEKKNQIQQKIDIQNDYLSKSLLFKDNSSDMQEAVFFYSIRDLNAVKEGSVQADNPAVSFALSFLQSSNFLYRVSEKIGLDLGEYRNLGLIEDFLKVDSKDSKDSKDSFIIRLLADSEDKLTILEKELEYFNTKLSIFCKDRYNVDIEKIGSGKVSISDLSELRNQALEDLLTLQSDLNAINAQIASVAEPVKFDDYGKLVDLETFKVMKLIKFIAIGLLFGLVVSVCYYIFRYLTAGKLRDPDFISDSFGINKISCIHDLDKKTNELAVKALSENLKYIIAKGNNSIIMLSTMMGTYEQQLSEIKTIIDNFNSKNGTDIKFVGPESINEINSADEVILTEKLDISDLNSVVDEVKTVLAVKEKVYGIVYI